MSYFYSYQIYIRDGGGVVALGFGVHFFPENETMTILQIKKLKDDLFSARQQENTALNEKDHVFAFIAFNRI